MATPDPVEERQPGLLQVARLPAGDEGVDGDDDRAVAGRARRGRRSSRPARVVGPVELEPARRRRRRPRRSPRVVKWEAVLAIIGSAERGGGAGGRQLAVGVDDLLHPDRRQQQRRRHRRPEHGGREVAVGDVAQHPRHDPPAAEGLEVGSASCPRCRRRRRRSRRPARLHRRHRPGAPARRPRPGSPDVSPLEAARVDLAVVVGEVGHRAKAIGRAPDRLAAPMIDTHTHLFLCDGRRARSWSPRPRGRRAADPHVGIDGRVEPRRRSLRAERHEEVFAAVGRHPNSADRLRRRGGGGDRRARRARARVRAIGETGLDYYRDTGAAGRPAARLRGADRDRPRARPAARDPRPRRRGVETTAVDEVFDTLDARGRRARGDPALLLGAAAGRRRGRARLVLLVRRQRHLPEAPRSCARRRRRCRRT